MHDKRSFSMRRPRAGKWVAKARPPFRHCWGNWRSRFTCRLGLARMGGTDVLSLAGRLLKRLFLRAGNCGAVRFNFWRFRGGPHSSRHGGPRASPFVEAFVRAERRTGGPGVPPPDASAPRPGHQPEASGPGSAAPRALSEEDFIAMASAARKRERNAPGGNGPRRRRAGGSPSFGESAAGSLQKQKLQRTKPLYV